MFCKFCGCEIEDGALFCTSCGKSLDWTESYTDTVAVSPVEQEFANKFSSKNFTVATVLYMVSSILTFVAGALSGNVSIPILNIFVIVAFWQLKNKAETQSPLASFASPLKILRIINVILRVFMWIGVGVFGVVGLLMVAIGASFNDEFAAAFIERFEQGMIDVDLAGFEELFGVIADNIFIFIIVIGAVFVVAAVVMAVFTATMYTTFVKCAKQYEDTANSGVNVITKQNSARAWIIVTAVFTIISAIVTLGSITTLGTAGILTLAGEVCNIVFLFLFADILKEDNLQ